MSTNITGMFEVIAKVRQLLNGRDNGYIRPHKA